VPPDKSWPSLEVVDGPGFGLRVPVNATVLIGSAESCHVVLHGSEISRVHASVVCHDGIYFLRDHGSAGGTQLDGRNVVDAALADGSRLTIGRTTFEFSLHRPTGARAGQRHGSSGAPPAAAPAELALGPSGARPDEPPVRSRS
jgi:pSer/pThr/pTyr-binding forkhead associated (FHA) protein